MYNEEQYPTLHMWKWESDYWGESKDGWYVIASRTRDSHILDISNFETTVEKLDSLATMENGSLTVDIFRERHCLCGWVDWIGIYYTNTRALDQAVEINKNLAGYPVLDEDDYYRRETEAIENYWSSLSIRERIDAIVAYGQCSFLAARKDYPPDDYMLEEHLRINI